MVNGGAFLLHCSVDVAVDNRKAVLEISCKRTLVAKSGGALTFTSLEEVIPRAVWDKGIIVTFMISCVVTGRSRVR